MLSDKALKDIRACLSSCDELINGRFIFAENIIAKILQNISDSPEIYALIAECMKNFNFDKEFNRAKVKLPTKDGYFVVPESKSIILPLVFCILVDIRDKKINFHEFLKNYFMSENLSEFENFSQTLIVPFKNAIMYCFDLEEQNNGQNEKQINAEKFDISAKSNVQAYDTTKQDDENGKKQEIEKINENNFNQKVAWFTKGVEVIAKQMIDELQSDKKLNNILKSDAIYLLNAILNCCETNDTNNLSAYIVAVEYVFKPIKSLKFLTKELKSKLIEFYNEN